MASSSEQTEYRFHIDAFSPETIPLERLAEYLGYIARIFGEKERVHFAHLEGGSTTPVLKVEREALPNVRERIHLVRAGDGPLDSMNAFNELNKRLAADNANGVILDPTNARVLKFPGRDAATHTVYGPFEESGTFEGIPIKVGGERADVPVHLDGQPVQIVYAPRRLARDIAQYIFSTPIRVEGKGKWMRDRMGDWIMQRFLVERFDVLSEDSLQGSITRLRAIPAEWKRKDDPLRELAELRDGEATIDERRR